MEEIPQSVEQLFDDANADLAVGDLPGAIQKYRQCVEIEPEFFDGWHALGMALMKNGDFTTAIDAGKKAVELHPNDQLAWPSLSLLYVRNNQIKEAEAAAAKAGIISAAGKAGPAPKFSTPSGILSRQSTKILIPHRHPFPQRCTTDRSRVPN